MKKLANILRIFTGILFIFSGLIKINDPVGTAIKLKEYFEVFSQDFSPLFIYLAPIALPLSVIICVLEVVLGVAMLLKYRMQLTSWVILLLILFFTFLTFYSAYFNKVTDCGCFGDAIKLTPWQSFSKDILLLVFILIVFPFRKTFNPVMKKPMNMDIAIVIVLILNVTLAVYAIRHLSYIDFRPYHVGASIPGYMKPSEPLRYTYIMEKGGATFEFAQYPSDTTYVYKDMRMENPEAMAKITDYNIWNDEGDFTQETFKGNKLLIIIENAKTANFNNIDEIKQLAGDIDTKVQTLIVTATEQAVFENFRHEYQLSIPYYYGDRTVLETMIRTNPGLILLKDGVVKGKWSHLDVPSAEKVLRLLE